MPMAIISPRSSRGAEPAANAAAVGTAALFSAGRRQKSLEFGLLILAIAVAAGVIWVVVRLALPGSTAPSEGRDSARIAGNASTAIDQSGSARTPETLPDFEGSIAKIHRTVQMRAGSELAWGGAEVGRAVHTEDAI